MLGRILNNVAFKHAQPFARYCYAHKISLIGLSIILLLPFLATATPGVIINEVSNGPSGSQEWVELLVVGDSGNPTDPVDLTGWILDDNNGDFEGSLTGVGIAQGYIAFSNAWNAVPPGSLIVIYNQSDRDPLIPADDVMDSNGDLVYIVPADDASLSGCSSTPTTASAAYLPCTLTTSIWSRSSFRNGGDAVQVRMPDGTFYHGFSYGDVGAPFPTFSTPGSPSSWNAGSGGTGSTFSFQCGDWEDSSEYLRSTASGRTPGAFNSPDNGNFINNVRYDHLNYNSLGNPNNCNYSPPTLTMTKTVSNNNPDPGEVFNFIIDASCNSSTEDCDNVVIVDTLPGTVEFLNFSFPLPDGVSSATYDLATREIVILFDASACISCSPDGIGDDNDFAQGASVQVLIQVQFPDGTIDGYQADNTAYAYSNNAPNSNSNAIATLNNGAVPGDFPDYKSGDSEQIAGGYQYWRIEVGNIGFDDISSYEIIDTIPDSIMLDQVRTPEFTDLDHAIDLYYMRSDNPGVWVLWDNLNLNDRMTKNVSGLSLPPTVRISQVRLNMYDVPATGLYNPYIYPDEFNRSWVLYGIASSTLPIGFDYTNCAYYSGVSAGSAISDVACRNTDIITPTNNITGGIAAYDTDLVERVTYNIEDTLVVGVEFASPGLMGNDVIGGVLSIILPPGLEYIPGSNYFDFGDHNADFQTPVVETEVIIDGRQLVRFVFDSSYSNSFVIEPTGGWEGFRINFETIIGPATTESLHTIEYYYNATDTDPDNCGDPDTENYLNGYAPDRCRDDEDILVVRAPSSAGLQSKIEVIGTLDLDYSRYPNYGRTVPGGISDYRIVLKNPNASTLDELTFITTLPYVGDTEVLDDSAPRYSEWQPFMVEEVTVPPGMQVYYSSVTNPCRDELAGSNPTPFPAGCNPASWSLTPPVDIATVTALKFEYGSNTLVQGDSIVVTWPMRAPVNGVPDTSIAWNSFAYQARNTTTSTYLLPAEPIKVGIELRPGNLPIVGDFVWNDIIPNGIQDEGEPGIDGVLVELYHDVNNNGIPEPNAGDTLETFTRTNNGGLYLFSDFDFGRYFVIFSDLPSGFVPTISNAGVDSIDSDGLVSDVRLFDNTIDDRTIDLGLYDTSYDADVCTEDQLYGIIPCFVSEEYNGPWRDYPAIVKMNIGWSGSPGDVTYQSPIMVASHEQVGAVYGMAHNSDTHISYASSYYKRGAGYGPNGPGAIYQIDHQTGVVSLYADINSLFVGDPAGTDTHDFSGDPTLTNFDAASRLNITKLSYGDIELSASGDSLFAINLNDKQLYIFPTNVVPTAANIGRIPLPQPGLCIPENTRPFALGRDASGSIYIGYVCSAEFASPIGYDSLDAYVYRWDGGNSFTEVLNFDLNFTRGGGAFPWERWGSQGAISATGRDDGPIFSDIEFDGNDMVLGFRVRVGDQAFRPSTHISGDIYRACWDGTDWNIEEGGICGGVSGQGLGTPAVPSVPGGPGGGHYYDNNDGGTSTPLSQGGIAIHDGIVYDAVSDAFTAQSAGLFQYNRLGEFINDYEVYRTTGNEIQYSYGKINGLGDLEILCEPTRLEIGDWVWEDIEPNGQQDLGELGIDGVTVSLWHDVDNDSLLNKSGLDSISMIAVTAGGGFYNFADFDHGQYFVEFSNLPVGYNPTYSNIVADSIDSDSLLSGPIRLPFLGTDYTIDLGLYNGTIPELCGNGEDNDGDGLIDCLDPDCDRISMANSISSCIDHPLEDIAQLTVDVSWTTPLNDTLELEVGGSSQLILMDTASSPTSVVFNVPADGSVDNIITASWGYYNSGCTEIDSFDAPIACSNDSISCNILYFCGDEKPSDGDAWDHGWIEYLNDNNGTAIVDAIFTRDEPGQGTYDPADTSLFVNIDYSNYDLIIVSATTEGYISSDLVDVLKGLDQSIILSNFEQVQAFELSNVAGFYIFQEDLYVDNTSSTQIYNYRNPIAPLYNNVFTHLDYRSDANAYLWNASGAQSAENQGVYVHYEASDSFPTIASHGPRTYFGFHMNQLFANQRNGGPVPAPTEQWFHPAKDLTLEGKIFFDQMIIEAASECGINCQIATMNPHVMYYRPRR